MPITVAMIEEKEFKTKVRGYDPVEVDEFLDEICDQMIVMQEEIANMQARLAQASRTSSYQPVQPRDTASDASESAQKIIARAQRMYDDTIADAKREAEQILSSARTQAANSEAMDLKEECEAMRQQLDALRSSARSYREKLLSLMQQQRKALDDLDV